MNQVEEISNHNETVDILANIEQKNQERWLYNIEFVDRNVNFRLSFCHYSRTRIAQNKVWFTRSMFTAQDKMITTKTIAKEHLQWKI